MFNKNAEVVGLIFDGNIQSLGGDFGYDDGSGNRAVAVTVGTLREACEGLRADIGWSRNWGLNSFSVLLNQTVIARSPLG